MWILIFILFFVFSIAGYFGSQPYFRLEHLTPKRVINTALIVMVVFTIMMIAYVTGGFPQSVAAPFMMGVYTLIAGFFIGYAYRQLKIRSEGGDILYQHRTFWVDFAPHIFAIILILYGLYRTALLTDLPITGIRLTSGFSLISFGLFGWTLKLVPEFRSKGVMLLDQLIEWKTVIAWGWHSEDVIMIEYIDPTKEKGNRIKQFVTSIPEGDRKEIEVVLKSKMDEYADARKKVLMPEED